MAVTLVLTLLFLLRISYERSASTVLSAIANEFSTGFKELLMDNVKLGRDTLIFTLIFAAAAFLSARIMTWQNLYVLAFGLLAFKHLAIYSSWKDFCLCHM